MKVILIDDEPLARLIVREYLQSYPQIEIVAECADGFEGVKAIQQFQPDLIFLDIQMPKITGFEMLELIEQPPSVIFTTAYDEYAIKAFETHATDYLLKPFGKERFDKAIQRYTDQQTAGSLQPATNLLLEAASLSAAQQHRIVVKNGTKIKIIPVPEILYLEGADDYVKIHTREGIFLKNKTMNYFEQSLDAQHFVRSHRSYIVNVQEVTRMEVHEKENHLAILKSGEKIPVSKTGYARLKAVLGL